MMLQDLRRDDAAVSAGLALAAATLSEHLSSQPLARLGEVMSEIVCWTLLPHIFATAKRFRVDGDVQGSFRTIGQGGSGAPSSSLARWVAAGSLVVVCLYRAEIGAIGLFVSHLAAWHLSPT